MWQDFHHKNESTIFTAKKVKCAYENMLKAHNLYKVIGQLARVFIG